MEIIFLITCLFPFVSFYPIESDVQPLVGILALIVIIKRSVFLNQPLHIGPLIFSLFTIIFLTYNNIFEPIFNPDFGKMLSLFFGSLIMLAFHYSKDFMTKRVLNISISVYFIYTILIMANTSLFYNLQSFLVRNINTTEMSYRGVSTFSTEPGLFGGLLIFFLLFTDYMFSLKRISSKNKYLLKVMIIIMIFLTKSGTGYLYLILYLLLSFKFKQNKRYFWIFTPFFAILLYSNLLMDINNLGRGFQVISQLSSPLELLTNDTSILSRIINLSISFYAIIEYPFGVGNGAVLSSLAELVSQNTFLNSWYMGREPNLNSSFSYLVLSHGIFFILMFAYLFLFSSKSKLINKVFSFTFFAVSYSSAFPAIWILLSFNDNDFNSKDVK